MAKRSKNNATTASEDSTLRPASRANHESASLGHSTGGLSNIFPHQWLITAVALIILTAAVFAPVRTFPFVDWDDPVYITQVKFVRDGLTGAGFVRAFSLEGHAANWHPLTTLSHMLDVSLFGLNAGRHHLVNLFIHLLNVMLLFILLTFMLKGTSASLSVSAFVAAIFAIHPMHVESVAWVAERKDVLSTFFFFATLLAYYWYAQRPSMVRYAMVAGMFWLGLMAKPMLVTLPFVLLLLDWWPLRRINGALSQKVSAAGKTAQSVAKLLLEKIPLFAMTGVSSLLTIAVQRRWGALVEGQNSESALRAMNAAVSYLVYLEKFFWPVHLAAFYPLDASVATTTNAVLSIVLLLGFTAAVLWYRKGAPYLAVGWFWFVGMLFPVIGLVRVGDQALADRYTYLPYVGLALALIMGLADLLKRKSLDRTGIPALGIAATLLLAITAHSQVKVWRSDRALWEHAAAVTRGNYIADIKLGNMLLAEGRGDEAMARYQHALEARPIASDAHLGMGAALADSGRWVEAIPHYQEALRLTPGSATAHNNLGNAYAALGQYSEADHDFAEALRLDSNAADTHANYAIALMQQGRDSEAEEQVRKALALDPNSPDYHFLLAAAMQHSGDNAGALGELELTLKLDPSHTRALQAYKDLGGDPSRIIGVQR